jgi:hypothetical protein
MLKIAAIAAFILAVGSAPVLAADTPAASDPGVTAPGTDHNGAEGAAKSDEPSAAECKDGWKNSTKWSEEDFKRFCAD